MFKCLRCNKEIEDKQITEKIRCPYCGYRILKKSEANVLKKVEAV